MVATRQGRCRQENAPLRRRRRRFLGFLPIVGVLPAAFQDLAGYGCRLSLFTTVRVLILKDLPWMEPSEFCFIDDSFSVIMAARLRIFSADRNVTFMIPRHFPSTVVGSVLL